jgi:peptidoglycan/LPS O-acetylase OafA/YrhL
MPPNRHIYFFDIVRALAAQAVLIGHLRNVVFPATFLVSQPDGRLSPLPGNFEFENLGVLAFFIISGFLITQSAQNAIRRGGTLPEFLIARASRIGTPYIALLLILFVVERQLYTDGQNLRFLIVQLDWQTFVLNASMLFNNPVMSFVAHGSGIPSLSAGVFGTMAQAWTLVLEWWIYVSFGIAFYASHAAPGWDTRKFALFCLACIVPLNSLVHGSGLLIAWIIGMVAATFHDDLTNSRRYLKYAVALPCLMIAIWRCNVTNSNLYDAIFVIFSSIFLMTLYFISHEASVLKKRSRLITILSDTSYSLYLTHLSVLIAFATLMPTLVDNLLSGAALYILCNLVGWLFFWAVERHYPVVTKHLMILARKVLSPDSFRPTAPVA